MLQRARLPNSFLLPAREYANYLDNRTARPGAPVTKYQKFTNSIPSFDRPAPLIFGTTVVVVEDVRGPKGSLDRPRASVGRFLGIRGSSYLVVSPRPPQHRSSTPRPPPREAEKPGSHIRVYNARRRQQRTQEALSAPPPNARPKVVYMGRTPETEKKGMRGEREGGEVAGE
eukprot:scaffold171998_cov30-Tisochrysis_lutea.AAC.2